MLQSPISSLELDMKIRKSVQSLIQELEEEKNPQNASRVSDLASDNRKLPIGVNFKSKKYKSFLAYLVILHYFPLEESVYCYMYIDLQDMLKKTESFWLTVLQKKELFLKYLVAQQTMTEQEFFSGICNKAFLREAVKAITLRFEEILRKPKRVIRRKGYRDKGTLGSVSHSVLKQELNNDFYLTLYQFQLEEEELLRHDLCILLEEFLSEGRVLTDESLVKLKIKQEGGKHYGSESDSSIKDYIKQREIGFYREKD